MYIHVILFGLGALINHVVADIYLHIPRGSNNRLNEQQAARKNANRLFDSQNNNRGGYNVGDKSNTPSQTEEDQYRMKYFQSDSTSQSVLKIEWTSQHGCGGNEDSNPQKQNCIMVLQYACQDDVSTANGNEDSLRNGITTETQSYTKPTVLSETRSARNSRKAGNVESDKGLHESWDWYDKCYTRERNTGLFTADQNLKANNGLGYSSAVYTRQNPAGNRYGYECPEERDYYPYWHPTHWKDISVLAENSSMCSYYQSKSFNVQPYGECIEAKGWSQWRTQQNCESNGGIWRFLYNYLEKAPQYKTQAACNGAQYMWAIPFDSDKEECLVKLPPPDCSEAPWSRSNHLGNGVDGYPNTYDWILPHFPSSKTKRCVFRISSSDDENIQAPGEAMHINTLDCDSAGYNISTDDYDPYTTDYRNNNDVKKMIISPVQQDPYVNIGDSRSPLKLAINTDQYGRVFQDRSHVFLLRPRPVKIQGKRIWNLNVRGKRGNIVQTFPAVEYDFAPTSLEIQEGDLVHIQWTGSNTHNNGNPAGDGQAGDTGEGTTGTDRHNLVQILDRNDNFPMPFEQSTMWNNMEVMWIYYNGTNWSPKDVALNMASSGHYRCMREADCGAFSVDRQQQLQSQLNNAPASYEGVVLKFRKGTYHYMCTRNNNFTNRSQKGTIICK